jgi:hypothetical protein
MDGDGWRRAVMLLRYLADSYSLVARLQDALGQVFVVQHCQCAAYFQHKVTS